MPLGFVSMWLTFAVRSLPGLPAPFGQACSCGISPAFAHNRHKPALPPEAPPHALLESVDAALQIGREMPGIAFPQRGGAPVVTRHPPAAEGRPALAIE